MLKNKKKSFFILFILVILSFIILLKEIVNTKVEEKYYNITIITEDEINENSITMKEGAEKAAEEMNVNIRFISLSKDNFLEEQKSLLINENNIDTDAILISPIRYEYLKEEIEKVNNKIPIILLNSNKGEKFKINTVSFDNYNMGVSMGNKILNLELDGKNLVIIKDDLKSDALEDRCSGLIDTLEDRYSYDVVEFKNDKHFTYYDEAKELIRRSKGDIFVSFNTEILESIAQVKSEYIGVNKEYNDIKVYGSGNTRKIISFLDQNIINGIVLENHFNIGYLGIKNAVNYIRNDNIENYIISSQLITHDDMYSIDNQRLLFLFIR